MSAYIRRLIHPPIIVTGTTTANWNSGVAPSGEAGATLVVMGRPGTWVQTSLCVAILTGFNIAATVTTREYMDIAGANRLYYEDAYVAPFDLAILWWGFAQWVYGEYRVEIHSDQAADDGLAVDWEYRIKDW